MHQRIQVVVITVISHNNKYLLTKRVDEDPEDSEVHGLWQMPGGGLEFGESPEQTAVREAKEELGIDIAVIRMIPRILTRTHKSWHGLLVSFECSMRDPVQEIMLNEEASEYRWFTLEEIQQLEVTPFTKNIQEILDVYAAG